MRIIILFVLLSTSSSFIVSGQTFMELPTDQAFVYQVPIAQQQPFIDSLFSEFRKASLRELVGIGERNTERSVAVGRQSYSYGVIVYYDATHVIIRFYSTELGKGKGRSHALEAIHSDYLKAVQMRLIPRLGYWY